MHKKIIIIVPLMELEQILFFISLIGFQPDRRFEMFVIFA